MSIQIPNSPRARAILSYLVFIVLTLIWGSNFILMKKAGYAFGPIAISFSRVVLGASVLWIILMMTEKSWPFTRKDLAPLLIPVLIGAVVPYSLLPWLINRNGSGLIGMMIGLVPIMTVIASIPLLNQWPGTRKMIGVIGGFFFLILLMKDSIEHDAALFDMILAALVPLCYAVTNTYIKRRFRATPPLALSLAVLALSAAFLLPIMFILPLPVLQPEASQHFQISSLALLTNGILATGISTYGFYFLIKERGPLFAGLVAYLIPLGAVLWGWADGEHVTSTQIISILGILAMVAFIELSPK